MRKSLLHLAFWFCFFLMWNRIMYFYVDNLYNSIYFSVLDVALVATAFYVVYLKIMPGYLAQKNIKNLLIQSLLAAGLLAGFYASIMKMFLSYRIIPIRFDFSWNYTDLQYNKIFVALLGASAGVFIKLVSDRMKVQRQLERLEKEQAKAELTYLKNQINPHFLFNSLNSLHAQLELNLPGASKTVLSLSGLLRYQLYDCGEERVPLQKELDYITHYVNLQRMRIENCTITLEINGDPGKMNIAPLLFIPFVENAFKYVSITEDSHNFIKITFSFLSGQLQFSCENNFSEIAPEEKFLGGIGLTNVSKRLELIYKDKHQLSYAKQDEIYNIHLTIAL